MIPTPVLPSLRALALILIGGLLHAVAAATGPADAAASPRALAVAETALSPALIVIGVLGYTIWPGEARSLQVCVTRTATDAVAILAQLEQVKAGRALLGRSIESGQPVPALCDAVYFDGWTAEAQRRALRALVGKPVLTLGRGAEFCSDGGLFCIAGAAPGTRFEVNLDAVARSGLRINPLALRLARPRPAAAS